MCNHLNAEHIRCRAVKQREGKTGNDELAQIGINRLTDLWMLKQQIRYTSNLSFKALAQTGNL